MIFINAPIAAGKTTLATALAQDLGTKAFLEDVNKIPLLQSFYDNGKLSRDTQSFALQIEFLSYRYRQLMQGLYLQREQGIRNTVYDSSLLSDNLMAKNLHDRGEFPDILYNDYLKLAQDMQANVSGHPFNGLPDLIVYLDIPFDLMLKHIAKRGRKMETTDPKLKAYYKSVYNTYRGWYKGYGSSPVIRIDMSKYDYVANLNDRIEVFDLIERKMYELSLLNKEQLDELKHKHALLLGQE